ncbi:MAG: hypothetical protein A3C15_04330 [Candidatus Magasanikbacteria bacterium RIFCSPHIGHO2_02_FULL_50_9b]|uniref:Helix-turn-helix domain-containing protein n=1 Tax=Candidatus Magasanikbacteria bacterium RIFCSPHIGHO2_02_FULL_50_9b TaxID=1798682 RepID=A0A1F6M7X5_9BACT|nr:MAG: hypothetical protein A3C15_04330 [Candidatus Magasanikbacteria bacterium RIFCSPHIGHO2_02_FULL_50_9b]
MSAHEIIRVSISEAAKLFGVNAQTIRRAIKQNTLSYVVVQGRYKISFESLLAWSGKSTTINNKMQTNGIGQYVDQWKIRNTIYAPNPEILAQSADAAGKNLSLFSVRPNDRVEVKQKPPTNSNTNTKRGATTRPSQNETLPL